MLVSEEAARNVRLGVAGELEAENYQGIDVINGRKDGVLELWNDLLKVPHLLTTLYSTK